MGRARKADRFSEDREIDNLDRIDERFEDPDFSDEEIERNISMSFQDGRYVDLRKKPTDMVYQWGRCTVKGMLDEDSLSRSRFGWKPVPLSRHPEFKVDDRIDGGESRRSGIIRNRGDILFERHIKWHQKAVAQSEDINYERMDIVTQMQKLSGQSPYQQSIRTNDMTMSIGKVGKTFA